MDILRGAGNLLMGINFILLELSMLEYNKNAPLYIDVINYLESKNFTLWDIAELSRRSDSLFAFQGDFLFINRGTSIFKEQSQFKDFK